MEISNHFSELESVADKNKCEGKRSQGLIRALAFPYSCDLSSYDNQFGNGWDLSLCEISLKKEKAFLSNALDINQ